MTAGPSVEQDIHQYYEANHPGEVVVLGADLFNCTPSALGGFRQSTGASYPLLLNSAIATGGDIRVLYGERDHYVVINKQGIVRYQANDRWPYGNGYHLQEIRGCVDSLVAARVHPVRIVRDPARRPRELAALRVGPGPSRTGVDIELVNPAGPALRASVTVYDLAGRKMATLLDGATAPGPTTLRWDGRDLAGRPVAAGIYHVRAEIAGVRLTRRIALVR